MQFIMPNNDVAMFFQNSWSSLSSCIDGWSLHLVKRNDYRFSIDFLYVWYVLLGKHLVHSSCICLDERFRTRSRFRPLGNPMVATYPWKMWYGTPRSLYGNNKPANRIPVRLHETTDILIFNQCLGLFQIQNFSLSSLHRNRWIIEDSASRILSSC